VKMCPFLRRWDEVVERSEGAILGTATLPCNSLALQASE
jgi:hypothetical protein